MDLLRHGTKPESIAPEADAKSMRKYCFDNSIAKEVTYLSHNKTLVSAFDKSAVSIYQVSHVLGFVNCFCSNIQWLETIMTGKKR